MKKQPLKETLIRIKGAHLLREADESDKYTHIGYGKYKQKGKEKDKDAQTFQKTDSGKFEPVGGDASGAKEKPEPKQTKIAADPFADKAAGVTKPKNPKTDAKALVNLHGGSIKKVTPKVKKAVATFLDTHKDTEFDEFEQKVYDNVKAAYESDNEVQLARQLGFYKDRYKDQDAADAIDKGDDQSSFKKKKNKIDKIINTVWAKGSFEGTEDDTFEAVELLRDKGIPDDEIRNWLDDEFDASEEDLEYWMTGDEDVYDDDDEDEWEESIIPQLKKEFKQYGFVQKSKNWKQTVI